MRKYPKVIQGELTNCFLWSAIVEAMDLAKEVNTTDHYLDVLELVAQEAIIRIGQIANAEKTDISYRFNYYGKDNETDQLG